MLEIAEFVASDAGKEFYRAAHEKAKERWSYDPLTPSEYKASNARADVFRAVESELGIDTGVMYDTLQDYFTLNMFRGKNVEKIQEKLERLV